MWKFSSKNTRFLIACIIGVLCTAASYHGLVWIFDQIGVHAHNYFSNSVERSISRYDLGDSDRELTLAGYAFITLAIVIGVNVSAATFKKTLKPWRTPYESSTAHAWWLISLIMPFVFSVTQLLARRFSDGLPAFIVSLLEIVIPGLIAWKIWKWWQLKSQDSKMKPSSK